MLQRECYRNYERQHPQPQEEQRNDEQRLPNVTTERYFKLKNVGLTVNRWERRWMELKRHKLERGHCDVPIDYPGVSLCMGLCELHLMDCKSCDVHF